MCQNINTAIGKFVTKNSTDGGWGKSGGEGDKMHKKDIQWG